MDRHRLGKMGGGESTSGPARWVSWWLWGTWLGLAGLAVAGWLGEYWWWFDLASHFRVQYVVIALVLSGFAVVMRRWRAATAAFLLAAVLGAGLIPYWLGEEPKPGGPERLRVLSANLLSSNSHTELVRSMLQVESPDVVVLLEYSVAWHEALRWLETDYPYYWREPRSGNFGIAVYSRRPIARQRVLQLGQDGPLCLSVDIDLAGMPVTIWGVHTYPPVSGEASAARNEQLMDLASHVRDDQATCVVVGDFNCTSWSPWFERLLADTHLRDSRVGHGVQATWPTSPFWLFPMRIPIDHCLVSQRLAVVGRRVTTSFGSDHLGVVVDLGWGQVIGRPVAEVPEISWGGELYECPVRMGVYDGRREPADRRFWTR